MNDKKLIAQELAKMGRYGDTMLAHITPHEAAVLKMMGGSGTINPHTGLPEYWGIGSIFSAVSSVVSSVVNVVKQVAPVLPVIIAVVAPEIIPAIGSSILGTSAAAAGTAELAAGAAAVSAGTTAATGGNIKQIARNAARAAVTVGVTSEVSGAVSKSLVDSGVPASVAKVAGDTAGAGASAVATKGNVKLAVATAALTSAAKAGYKEFTKETPSLTRDAETTSPVDATKPVDYSLKPETPSRGEPTLKAPELAPLPPAEQIGITPIDYGNILAPKTSGLGMKTPKLRDLPPAEQIGTKPVDYKNILTPEVRNLPEMGGGTGVTSKDITGGTIQLAPTETSPIKQAGQAATQYLAGQYASSLYDQPKSASTLTSTGLFTPQSIVPSGLTGIAPIARGKPILGGEDEEATGAWGAKTLRA